MITDYIDVKPDNPKNGDMYYGSDNKYRCVYAGGKWYNLTSENWDTHFLVDFVGFALLHWLEDNGKELDILPDGPSENPLQWYVACLLPCIARKDGRVVLSLVKNHPKVYAQGIIIHDDLTFKTAVKWSAYHALNFSDVPIKWYSVPKALLIPFCDVPFV